MTADFIKMISEVYNEKYLRQLQNLAVNKIPCGFFAGFSGSNNISAVVNDFKNSGINITCICCIDANQMGGGENLNIPLITLEELPNSKFKPSVMFYNNMTVYPIFMEYFLRFGIEFFWLTNAHETETIYNLYLQNLPNLYEVHEMLTDEESKKVFCASIKGNLTGKIQDFRYAPEPQYFFEGFLPNEGDIAIDGGAYDGSTSRDFAMCGAKVYAFEMDTNNYKKCLPCAEKYNFTIENLGLSNREGQEFYNIGGSGSRKGQGNVVGKFIDLDTYVERKNLPRVDYIKLDIEGAELDMLHGAFKTVSRWKPKMAISAYHRSEDLWTLALYIKSIRPDYEFKFKHYPGLEGVNFGITPQDKIFLQKLGLSCTAPAPCELVLYCK